MVDRNTSLCFICLDTFGFNQLVIPQHKSKKLFACEIVEPKTEYLFKTDQSGQDVHQEQTLAITIANN